MAGIPAWEVAALAAMVLLVAVLVAAFTARQLGQVALEVERCAAGQAPGRGAMIQRCTAETEPPGVCGKTHLSLKYRVSGFHYQRTEVR